MNGPPPSGPNGSRRLPSASCTPTWMRVTNDAPPPILEQELPGVSICLSSEVSPEIREYDRLSTTVANAYVRPLIAGYVGRLETSLREHGLACPLLLTMSSGAVTTVGTARQFPVRLVESGPAGGAVLARTIAAQHWSGKRSFLRPWVVPRPRSAWSTTTGRNSRDSSRWHGTTGSSGEAVCR